MKTKRLWRLGLTGIPARPMNSKALEIYIPFRPNPSQQLIFDAIIAEAKLKGINVIVPIF